MAFYDETYLAERRKEWIDRIKTVKYCENGVWKTATINSKAINGTEMVIMAVAHSTGSNAQVTQLNVFDAKEKLVGSEVTNIQRLGTQNLLFKITLTMEEG